MPEIPSIGHGSVGPVNRAAGLSPQEVTLKPHEQNGRVADRVELSDRARWLDRLAQLPGVRIELVERVRQALVDGTYDTPEKLEAAVQRLLEDELV
jgi:negative regulator of flagellin synthesis FlgM